MQASHTLEQTILRNAPRHYATPDAPNTWKELQDWWESKGKYGEPMPVFDGGCDQTIYSQPYINHAFRAWHDMIHLKNGLSFQPEDEAKTAFIHMAACDNVADALTIFADVYGQVLFYQKTGQFVENQSQFVGQFIKKGYTL